MENKYFVTFNEDGFLTNSYQTAAISDPDKIIPEDAIQLSEEDWQDLYDNQHYRRWDGEKVVEYTPPPPTPEEIRANMPDLERWRVNTVIDLEPGLRDKINAAIAAMPEPTRTISKNKLADVQMFRRTDPLFDLIGSEPSIGKSPEDIDAMWLEALNL